MRVGRIIAVEPFPAARKPAYRLTIDFGPGGIKRSSAQLPPTYPDPQRARRPAHHRRRQLRPRNIAGFQSEVLVLGALPADGSIPLLGVDSGASPGDPDRLKHAIPPGSMRNWPCRCRARRCYCCPPKAPRGCWGGRRQTESGALAGNPAPPFSGSVFRGTARFAVRRERLPIYGN